MKTALLIGATGIIGSATTKILSEAGYKIHVIDLELNTTLPETIAQHVLDQYDHTMLNELT